MAEISRTKNDTETTFAVRSIRFSLELANASRRRDTFPRQIADSSLDGWTALKPAGFYNRTMSENKSADRDVAASPCREVFRNMGLVWNTKHGAPLRYAVGDL